MPRAAIRTGEIGPGGREIILSEYLCDWPNCANVAEHIVGVVVELRSFCVVCPEHAAVLRDRASRPRTDAP